MGKAGALSELAEWVGKKFYRSIPRAAEAPAVVGPEAQAISGLKMVERGNPTSSPAMKANTRDYVWASDNPWVADSYTHQGGVMIPMQLTRRPDAVLDAGGASWEDWFFKNGDYRKMPKAYVEALRDPGVRSILIQNIIDQGQNANQTRYLQRLWENKLGGKAPEVMGPSEINYLNPDQYLIGNSLLIKDPSVMRYRYSKPDDVPQFRRGGLAQVKECSCHR
jgi:hypothetical protein